MSGASLILGFLSFSGTFVLWPVLPVAIAAFVLSVVYEGEIYLQNITGAMNKLFKHNHMKQTLAKAYLLEHFPDTSLEDCPQFFKDYEAQSQLLIQVRHKKSNNASPHRKKAIEKTLRDMEKWFARQLFSEDENNTLIDSDYQKKLQLWLEKNQKEAWQEKFHAQKNSFYILQAASVLAALFMGLGTTYLLVEAFAAIPFLAALSFGTLQLIIAPMAVIAGVAYGLLTYNTITDIQTSDKLFNAFEKIKQDGFTWRNAMLAFLIVLALGLTICTAGTWMTVIKEARPLFAWMGNLPGFTFIMEWINPLVTGLSALAFNAQNTIESLEILDEFLGYDLCLMSTNIRLEKNKIYIQQIATDLLQYTVITASGKTVTDTVTYDALELNIAEPFNLTSELKNTLLPKLLQITSERHHTSPQLSPWLQIQNAVSKGLTHLAKHEHWSQWINPFRVILKFTVLPLRIVFFIGHLLSIAMTADRPPGIPQILSAIFAFISEGFEDFHFFAHFDHCDGSDDACHEHEHEHEHEHLHEHEHGCEHDHEDAHKQFEAFRKKRFTPGPSHHHSIDLPTQCIYFIFSPIYLLAAYWDYTMSQFAPEKPLTWEQAWGKQWGYSPNTQEADEPSAEKETAEASATILSDEEKPSLAWQIEHAAYRIERHKEKQLRQAVIGAELACQKENALSELQAKLSDLEKQYCQQPETVSFASIKQCIFGQSESTQQLYNTHRTYSFFGEADTSTREFLNHLPERVQCL